MLRRFIPALALLTSACAAPLAQREASGPVTVGIIAINDFHGNLETPREPVELPDGKGGTAQVTAGSAARLATAIDTLREAYEHHVTVSAGDLISASPLTSSLFLDEPTIAAMNRIGLEINAVGNHEFDRGRAELLRMQAGGCEKHALREPCALEPFTGADFAFLAASTLTESGETLFPATAIKRFGAGKRQVAIGFIGLTLAGTPRLVSPGGIAGLKFGDEAEAINREVPRLKAQGADAVVVLIHEGARMASQSDPNACDGLGGAIAPIVAKLDPRVDVVVSGHTHQAYVCETGETAAGVPLLLTSAGFYGRLVTELRLTIDPATDRVVAHEAVNHVVAQDRFAERGDIAALVGRYSEAASAYGERIAGRIDGPATRAPDGMGGSLGNLIADAQLSATREAGAQMAFTNPFGIRAALQTDADGTVTFAQIHAVQPFGNTLVTQTLSGEQIRGMLEQGVDDSDPVQLLAPSAGLAYRVDRSRPVGSRVVALTLDGEPLAPEAHYRVTTNSFLAQGGDGFTMLTAGRAATRGPSDLDAFELWLRGDAPRAVPQEPRALDATPADAGS